MKGIVYVATAFLATHPAAACSCLWGFTTCGSLSTAQVAFIGTIIEGTHDQGSVRQFPQGRAPAKVAIERVISGLETSTTKIEVNPSISTSCYLPMLKGERWLVLGKLRDGVVFTGTCSGSSTIQTSGSPLIEAVDSFTNGPNLVRVEVRKYQGRHSRFREDALLSGAEVVVRGAERDWSARTGEDGQASFRALPPGEYELRVKAPGLSLGLPGDSKWAEAFTPNISLNSLGCVDKLAMMWPDQGISGTVRDVQGRPVAGVNVGAFEVVSGNRAASTSFRNAITDSQGRYHLPRLLDGRYIVGVNAEMGSDDGPYRPRYHPAAVLSRSAAPVLVSGRGRDNIDIWLGPPSRRIDVRVNVVFADGKPAPNAYLSFARDGKDDELLKDPKMSPRTNKEGTAKVSLWEGDLYNFWASGWKTDPQTNRHRFVESTRVRAVAILGASPVVTLEFPKH